jgi:hypothetical protein
MRSVTAEILAIGLLEGKKFWGGWEKQRTFGERTSRSILGRDNASAPIEVDFSKFNPDDYLLSWCTAVSGLEPEEDGHSIVGPHCKWVNDNGNGWLNQVLLENYHSFIMAENYQEHIQDPELSKGKILDAVSWVVERHADGYREAIPTIFIDVLVATNKKKHPRLIDDIRTNRINTMSMGCDITHSQCSRCGRSFIEGKDEPCEHIKRQLGRYYKYKDGRRKKVAELCGLPGKKGSCRFKEVSWVRKPAFYWAKRHGFIPVSHESTGRPLKALVPKDRMREMAEE